MVLKTLGATRNRIAAVFSIEFVVLGLLAGIVGVIFANLLSASVVTQDGGPIYHPEFIAEWDLCLSLRPVLRL